MEVAHQSWASFMDQRGPAASATPWPDGPPARSRAVAISPLKSSTPPQPVDGPALKQRVAACDAFIVVTPEYNHGYPAPLKALIDSFGAEWHAKPVAFRLLWRHLRRVARGRAIAPGLRRTSRRHHPRQRQLCRRMGAVRRKRRTARSRTRRTFHGCHASPPALVGHRPRPRPQHLALRAGSITFRAPSCASGSSTPQRHRETAGSDYDQEQPESEASRSRSDSLHTIRAASLTPIATLEPCRTKSSFAARPKALSTR